MIFNNNNDSKQEDWISEKSIQRRDKAEIERVELHLHTRYSTMDALTDPSAAVARAASWGMPAIAVTDHGTAQAFPEMWKAGEKYGVKIIYGMEAFFIHQAQNTAASLVGRIPHIEQEKSFHLVLLVQNRTGLKNLYELITASNLKYRHGKSLISKSELDSHREGLLVGSACSMGELYDAVMRGEDENALEEICSYYDYLEIQPLSNSKNLVAKGRAADEDVLKGWNRKIYDLGKKLNKPVTATSDVHYLDAEDEVYRRILAGASRCPEENQDCPLFFRTTEEMLKEFEYLGIDVAREVVITNTNAIASQVDSLELFPAELCLPTIENSAADLQTLVYSKMHQLYGETPPRIVQDRVDAELTMILKNRYDVIYMTAHKLVQKSLEEGYLVGNRGGVGSSVVAFLSGITEVNALPPHYVCSGCKYSEFIMDDSCGCGTDLPEKNCPVCGEPLNRDGFNIPFETFLGCTGYEKVPDIDLNFAGEFQADAHRYTQTLFGSDHVFRAGTIGTLSEKGAYGIAKKYLGEHGIKADGAEEQRLSHGLVGIKCTTGKHPGGLVIIPQDKDITDFCPLQYPEDDPDSNTVTTHFEYHWMEPNLLKMDELGHDDPTMIRMMEEMTGVEAKRISLSDRSTMSIFTSPKELGLPDNDPIIGHTGTKGVPDFETAYTRQILTETKPARFDSLVRISALSHGTGVWNDNVQDLIANGTATIDEVIGSRDDIMNCLTRKGMDRLLAFRTMEAVRKSRVRKSGSFPMDAEEQMRELDVPSWWIESCRKTGYLFPKAHAAAYTVMAFRIAWFKVHKPLAFYSAYFYRQSRKGAFDLKLMTSGKESVQNRITELRLQSNPTEEEIELMKTLEVVYEFYVRGFAFAPVDLHRSDIDRFLITEDEKLLPPQHVYLRL